MNIRREQTASRTRALVMVVALALALGACRRQSVRADRSSQPQTAEETPAYSLDALRALCLEERELDACLEAARRYEEGDGVEASNGEALNFFADACNLEDRTACLRVLELRDRIHAEHDH